MLGASGGTGLAAVELGKVMGARVIACASSDEKLDFAREHGADEAINYAKEDLKEALRRVTGGKGVDVIYDPVGGAYAEAALRSLAWQGRFLVIGFAAGEIPKMPLNLVLLKGCDMRRRVLGRVHRARSERPSAPTWPSWCAGPPRARSRRTCTRSIRWRRRRAALKAIADRKVMGKVILRP